jgi:hypothetical protein
MAPVEVTRGAVGITGPEGDNLKRGPALSRKPYSPGEAGAATPGGGPRAGAADARLSAWT